MPIDDADEKRVARNTRWALQILAGATVKGIAQDEEVSTKTVQRGINDARIRIDRIRDRLPQYETATLR